MSDPRWLNEQQAVAWRGLLAIINRAFPEIERTLRGHDLLAVHYTILVALSEAPDHTMGLSALADAANLSPSRLSHRMRTLVDRGDVVIAPDPEDGRAKNAHLTPPGLARLEAVAPHHVEDVQRLIFDHLDETETAALADALALVAAALCEHPEYLNPRP
ncbi:MAG: MarR family winged helix-turn-helix transcriptional regulator [Actinomycetota bacterium]